MVAASSSRLPSDLDLHPDEIEALRELIAASPHRDAVAELIRERAAACRDARYSTEQVQTLLQYVLPEVADLQGFLLDAFKPLRDRERIFWGSSPREHWERALLELAGARAVVEALRRYAPLTLRKVEREQGWR